MSLELVLKPDAEADIIESAFWYEFQQLGLGVQLIHEIQATFSRIVNSPLMYNIVHRGARRALTRKFPFGVYYRVTEKNIVVIAVMHVSRNPRCWWERVS